MLRLTPYEHDDCSFWPEIGPRRQSRARRRPGHTGGETQSNQFLETLMAIALQHMAADQGMLVLVRGDKVLTAKANSSRETIDVAIRQATMTPSDRLPPRPDNQNGPDAARPGDADEEDMEILRRSMLGLSSAQPPETTGHAAPRRIDPSELLASEATLAAETIRLQAELIRERRKRRQAEDTLKIAQQEMARMARLITVGEFAASIAHEVNQPLTAVVTNADIGLHWLEQDKPDLGKLRDAVLRIVQAGTRAANVIRSLRTLVQKSERTVAQVDINVAIEDVLALTRSELHRSRLEIRTDLAADLPHVRGDRVQLQQVLLNLIRNAIDAMSAVTDRPRTLTISSRGAEAGAVTVAVRDSGVGLDPASADRIFEPFFTTKSNGMGMGLWISRSIVEAHGGRLAAAPQAPHGAEFRFTVPGVADR